jgi:hypothetical protein
MLMNGPINISLYFMTENYYPYWDYGINYKSYLKNDLNFLINFIWLIKLFPTFSKVFTTAYSKLII